MAYLSDIFKGNESGLHVGTLATFLKGKVPAGYLIPNGAEFSSLEYPELFTYLGSNKLPDLIDDESVPVGSIMPWMSDSDIPDGWHHLGAQGGTNEISSGQRKYDPEQYPEFCKFLQTVRGDNYLRVMRFGEVLRQVVKETPQGELNTPDVTDAWGWQSDAIRPVTGHNAYMYGNVDKTTGDGVFRWNNEGEGAPSTTYSSAGNNIPYDLNFDISRVHPVAKDVRMVNRSVNYLIKVKPSKITKTTIAIKAAGRVSDEGLMQVEGIRKELDTFSHANLFINGSLTASQRYGIAATVNDFHGGYFTDRWYHRTVTYVGGTLKVQHMVNRHGSYLACTHAGSTSVGYIVQHVEPLGWPIPPADTRNPFPSKQMTVSFYFSTGSSVPTNLRVEAVWKENGTGRDLGAWSVSNDVVVEAKGAKRVELTFDVPESDNLTGNDHQMLSVFIQYKGADELNVPDGRYDFSDLKLEFGSRATLFVPDDPATNLAKCRRYYKKFNSVIINTYKDSFVSKYHITNASTGEPMRSVPSIKMASFSIYDAGIPTRIDSNAEGVFFEVSADGMYMRIGYNANSTSYNFRGFSEITDLELDAEL